MKTNNEVRKKKFENVSREELEVIAEDFFTVCDLLHENFKILDTEVGDIVYQYIEP